MSQEMEVPRGAHRWAALGQVLPCRGLDAGHRQEVEPQHCNFGPRKVPGQRQPAFRQGNAMYAEENSKVPSASCKAEMWPHHSAAGAIRCG